MTLTARLTHGSWNPLGWVARYTHWLHTKWPAGDVEKLPVTDEHGRTNVPGLYLVGDLTGIPLLKLSANSGVHAIRRIATELNQPTPTPTLTSTPADDVLDVAIVGGGTSGFAAALEASEPRAHARRTARGADGAGGEIRRQELGDRRQERHTEGRARVPLRADPWHPEPNYAAMVMLWGLHQGPTLLRVAQRAK